MVLTFEEAIASRNAALLALPDDLRAFVRTFGPDRAGPRFADLSAMGLEPLIRAGETTTIPWPYRLPRNGLRIEHRPVLEVVNGRVLVPSEIFITLREVARLSPQP